MYSGSCHCGRISFEVEGDLSEVKECNCSHCSRKGYLLWFVSRDQHAVLPSASFARGERCALTTAFRFSPPYGLRSASGYGFSPGAPPTNGRSSVTSSSSHARHSCLFASRTRCRSEPKCCTWPC